MRRRKSPLRVLSTALLLIPTALAADLPGGGTCLFDGDPTFRAQLSWQGQTGSVTVFYAESEARVIGLRPHGAGFKLSLFFDHPVVGEMEALLFSLPEEEPAYRLGLIGYDRVEEGDMRVAALLTDIQPGACTLR